MTGYAEPMSCNDGDADKAGQSEGDSKVFKAADLTPVGVLGG